MFHLVFVTKKIYNLFAIKIWKKAQNHQIEKTKSVHKNVHLNIIGLSK